MVLTVAIPKHAYQVYGKARPDIPIVVSCSFQLLHFYNLKKGVQARKD